VSERVVVCMSGGVDSTIAALRLKEAGHDVQGLTFWFWSFPAAPDYARRTECCALDEAAAAAVEIGVPHATIDASDAFYDRVLRDYVERYRRGETPNPCGRCNRFLRFGLALDYAQENGFDAVATGHHVRIVESSRGEFEIHRGRDRTKDQTYFLYGLRQRDLAVLRFPVGELTKSDVNAIARGRGLACAERPESQDLCFALAGETHFLFDEGDFEPGPIVDREGHRLGTHDGLPNYTVGQRRGIGIPSERPLYVIAIDAAENRLVVGPEEALVGSELIARDANYLSGRPPEDGKTLDAKIRYRSPATPATFRLQSDDRFALSFHAPQRAITPGQIAAVYDGDRLLGGGTIEPSKANG
jgi:tRNA-specific 2-thiouridylase